MFLPDGMAHGFVSLTHDSCVSYVFDTPYVPGTPFEINPFDPDLGLPWPLTEKPVVAAKGPPGTGPVPGRRTRHPAPLRGLPGALRPAARCCAF